ncbi:MAG: homocysteine S-methyltransferase family protein [Anaerolineae bacterium]|nr:homocysteine S-methyltransferase family protein [Anaerolineae bacterium]
MEAPDVVAHIHRDYLAAGAQVLTANTFRTNPRTLRRAGITDGGRALSQTAVALAKQVVGYWLLENAPHQPITNNQQLLVAGSIAPVEDCYSPELVPSDDELREEHGELARNLADAGCDVILVETMNTIREAVIAAQSAASTGLPLWVSFTLNEHNHLLSGETLAAAVCAVLPYRPQAALVNCIPVAQVGAALRVLRDATQAIRIAFGAYGNVGHVDDEVGWTLTHAVTPSAYAEAAREWQALGATIIGGCCGTMPEHIAALAALSKT